jgi:hypothetical protein
MPPQLADTECRRRLFRRLVLLAHPFLISIIRH